MRILAAPVSPRHSRGFTLVEIMVGVAIGLIGIVAIFQAVATWSKHTAATSSGGDAQVAGTLALFNIERDVKAAGHGFGRATAPNMGCIVNATDTTPARVFNFQMAPVQIAAGAGGAPDQITILYGDSSFHAGDDPNISTGSADFSAATATSKTLLRRGGFKPGDFAIAAYNPGALPGSAQCQLLQITADTNPDGRTVDHTTAPFTSFYTGGPAIASRFNSAVAPLAAGGKMYNLGPDPRLNVWSIQNNGRVLTQTDVIHNTAALQVAESVVNLKAEYGVDLDGNGTISAAEWVNAPPADWRTLLAIRVAVLVRSRNFERNGDPGATGVRAATPSAANPYYFGDPVGRKFLMTNVDGTADAFGDVDAVPNNWRYYRYRVYERVIPLRNMLWGIWG